jgi:hypothetical protein
VACVFPLDRRPRAKHRGEAVDRSVRPRLRARLSHKRCSVRLNRSRRSDTSCRKLRSLLPILALLQMERRYDEPAARRGCH